MLAWTIVVACLATPLDASAVVNAWTRIGPPGRHALTADAGSLVQSVTVDPSDSSVLYVATTEGVFRSRDRGASWTLVYDLFRAFRIVVDPTDSRIVYAAGESGPQGSGVILSTDGGDTWSTTSFTPAAYDLAIDPASPRTLWAVTMFDVFRTTDGGATWQGGATGIDPSSPGTLVRVGSSSLCLANGTGVYRSQDQGRTWTLVLPTGARVALAAAADGSVVYAAWDASLALIPSTISRSTDGGMTWTPPSPLPGPHVEGLAVDPSDPAAVYASMSSPMRLFKSIDGGDGWIDLSAGATNPFPKPPDAFELFSAVTIDPNDPAVLYLPSSVPGVQRSDDGGVHWRALGVEISSVRRLARHPLVPGTMFVSTTDGVFRTRDDGANWTPMSLPGPTVPFGGFAFDPNYSPVLYAAAGIDVFRTGNGGFTWAASDLPLVLESVTAVVVSPILPLVLYAATCGTVPAGKNGVGYFGGVSRSTDGGVTWPPVVVLPPRTFKNCVNTLVIDESPSSGEPFALYAGAAGGVFASTDGGVSWNPTGPGMENAFVTLLVQDPMRRSVLYAVRQAVRGEQPGDRLLVSSDRGATWREIGADLPPVQFYDFAVDSAESAFLYAATDKGLFVSRSAGEHWTTGGLHDKVTALAVEAAPPRTIYAGTDGQGILRQRVTECTSTAECDDADSCTVDRCEPTSALGDLGGCVHDHADLPGIRCVLEDALARTRCAGDRIERRIDAGLTRAMQLVDRASATPAGPARTVRIRRAKRAVSRLVRRLNRFVKRRPVGVCLDPVRQQVAGIRSTLRTLSSAGALSGADSTRRLPGPS